jgi:hypothetical protein
MPDFPLQPDWSLIMPSTAEYVFLALGIGGCLFYGGQGIRDLIRDKNPLMLFCLLGGLFGEMLEPICNVLGWAFHPDNGQLVGFHTLGRDIPLWLVLVYPWYFGKFAHTLITWDRNGELTKERFWRLFGTAAAFCFLIEVWPVQVVLWDYYGPQPLTFFGMPLMWYIVNPTSVLATASFALLATRGRNNWGCWPILVTMPVCIVGFHTGVFAPTYISMNAGWTATQSIFTAVITTFFAFVMLNVFKNLLLGPSVAKQSVSKAASKSTGRPVAI